MSVPHDFTDDEERGYEEMDERLKRFDAGLDAILLREKAESEDLLLTPRQLDWRELRFFFEASIVNAGDLFGYLSMVYDRPELFERIGALKTLAAAEKLRNLHGQYSRLPDDEAKNQFWLATRERRKPIEETAEGLCEFADLLIRFAERHPKEFREIEICDYLKSRLMDLLQNFINSKERANRLYRFDAGLNAVLREALGEDWLLGTPEDDERFLSPRQRDWRRLRDFYEVMANSGDLFSYLPMVYARPELFEEIGAVRTLAAAEGLRGFHDACLRLPTQDEQDQFWRDTQEQRKPIENTADTLIDFADLLIRFAERHPGEFREMEARNPFDGMSELLSAMRCQAVRDGRITQESDAAAGLMDHLRKSPPGVDGQTQ